MIAKVFKILFLQVIFVVIFGFGVFFGSNLNSSREKYVAIESILPKETKVPDSLPPTKEQDPFDSFSYAYNKTHLWSMRLADENHFNIARKIPCRSVKYLSGPITINETMDTCNQTVKDEFSVESTLRAQQWLYEHQHPMDCTNKKFAIIHKYAWSGIGSTIHQVLWAFGEALGEDRIAVYRKPGGWVRK